MFALSPDFFRTCKIIILTKLRYLSQDPFYNQEHAQETSFSIMKYHFHNPGSWPVYDDLTDVITSIHWIIRNIQVGIVGTYDWEERRILCSYWSCVPTDPVILLILCSYWYLLYLYSYWSSVPTDPVFLPILCSYWSCVPTDPVFLLIPCFYWSSVLMLWRQSGRRTWAMSHNPAIISCRILIWKSVLRCWSLMKPTLFFHTVMKAI